MLSGDVFGEVLVLNYELSPLPSVLGEEGEHCLTFQKLIYLKVVLAIHNMTLRAGKSSGY